MTRITTLTAATAALLAGAPALAQQTTWTMTSTWPTSIELIEADRHWVELVNELVGDELEINFQPGGAIVPSGEVFGAVQSGTIQAGGDWPGYWAGRSSAFSPLASHPSLFNAIDYLNWIQDWGGKELYDEVYGQFGMKYLPYGVTNNESGFRTQEPIRTLEDLQGKRLRLSGLDQGKVLERLGGNQVSMSGGEIYQALERGVIDGAEFSVPSVDWAAGFQEVTEAWATPGWHQSAALLGVMINQEAWDALSEDTQRKLEIAADANMAWSIAYYERRSSEATRKFEEAGIEITRYSDEALQEVQEISNEVMVESACNDPLTAKVYASQLEYLADYKVWRDASKPFNLGRTPDGPPLEEVQACVEDSGGSEGASDSDN